MGKCVVKKCDSRSQTHNKATGITFHTLPKNPECRDRWVKVIRLLRKETDWLPTKSTVICSKHFRDEDKIGPKSERGHVYLSNEAIPILIDDRDSHEVSEEENMDLDDVETDEEIEEITESPRQHQMRKMIHHLRTLCAKRRKKIKALQQRNRRLERNNKKLKDALKEMKIKKSNATKCKLSRLIEQSGISKDLQQ